MERHWYAVMRDHDDNDWGYGSYDLLEAKSMARKIRDNGCDDAFIDIVCEAHYDDEDCVWIDADPISVGHIYDLD